MEGEQLQQEGTKIQSKSKPIDPEFNLDDEKEAQYVEARALEDQPQINLNALPTRLYLEKAILPTVYQALEALEKERPINPIEFFSYYLITHNPYSQQHAKVSQNSQESKPVIAPTQAEIK
ncbi:hypothetical protein ABPG72_022696 [Tetrahymena utriculariae]